MKKIIKRAIGASFLLIGATLMMNFLSCKKETDGGGTTTKDFDITSIKVWGKEVKKKDKITVSGTDGPKTLEVVVNGCPKYNLEYELKGTKDSKDSKGGEVDFENFEIPREEGMKLYLTFKADGFNTLEMSPIKITRSDSDAPDVKVMLKIKEDAVPVEVVNGENYPTSGDTATVSIVSTGKAEFETVTIAGSDITINDTNKKKVEKTDVATNGNVEVKATFKYYQDSITNFSLEKVAPGQVPVKVRQATVSSGKGYENKNSLTFADENGIPTASVELEDIEYSCVKLEMETDVALKADESGLQECKDERSENYSTQPVDNDFKGIVSGKLIKELDKDGKVTKEYNTPIVGKKLTEYLIIGAGTVEYKFKLKADGRKETECVVKITNKSEARIKPEGSGENANYFVYYNQGYFETGTGYPCAEGWLWRMHSPLPLLMPESTPNNPVINDLATLEYMGDLVKHSFFYLGKNKELEGLNEGMYSYYSVYDDVNAKKKEFVRRYGEYNAQYKQAVVDISFDPEEKYVDAFIAFKKFLPKCIYPTHTQKKWKKIVKKGVVLGIEPNLDCIIGRFMTNGTFTDIFNYRMQAKTYEKKDTLKIGYKQKYKDWYKGEDKDVGSTPFLTGGKTKVKYKTQNGEVEFNVPDLMILTTTFSSGVERFSYSIKKNNIPEVDWTDISLTPSEWGNMFVLNAKQSLKNISPDVVNKFYVFEKGEAGSENKYEIIVKIKPVGSEEEEFKYEINYKDEQTLDLMDLGDSPSTDSNLFGVPTSYAECANREVQAMFRETMAQDYARASLISR